MKKIAIVSVAVVGLMVGCGGKKTSSSNSNKITDVPPPQPQPAMAEVQQPVTVNVPVTTVAPAPAESHGGAGPVAGQKYTVRKGDTLWNIATRAYGDGKQYKKIVAANPSIKNDRIAEGQSINIPR